MTSRQLHHTSGHDPNFDALGGVLVAGTPRIFVAGVANFLELSEPRSPDVPSGPARTEVARNPNDYAPFTRCWHSRRHDQGHQQAMVAVVLASALDKCFYDGRYTDVALAMGEGRDIVEAPANTIWLFVQ